MPRRRVFRSLVLPVATAFVLASAPASAENGVQPAAGSPDSQRGPVEVDGEVWNEFYFTAAGKEAEGCQGLEDNGLSCVASSGGNSQMTDDPPWTFTAGPGGAVLVVSDVFDYGDRFEVFNHGVSLGVTSEAGEGGSCGSDPDFCREDPDSSSGVFVLEPGEHAISIVPTVSVLGSGSAHFRVESSCELHIDSVEGRWDEDKGRYVVDTAVFLAHYRTHVAKTPMTFELTNRRGHTLARGDSGVLEIHPGDELVVENQLKAPKWLPSGTYYLKISIDTMNGVHKKRTKVVLD